MQNTWEFKEQENAALFAAQALRQGADCVLIRIIKRKPQGDFYVVAVTGNLDGITPPGGCVEPQTTLTTPRYEVL